MPETSNHLVSYEQSRDRLKQALVNGRETELNYATLEALQMGSLMSDFYPEQFSSGYREELESLMQQAQSKIIELAISGKSENIRDIRNQRNVLIRCSRVRESLYD